MAFPAFPRMDGELTEDPTRAHVPSAGSRNIRMKDHEHPLPSKIQTHRGCKLHWRRSGKRKSESRTESGDDKRFELRVLTDGSGELFGGWSNIVWFVSVQPNDVHDVHRSSLSHKHVDHPP